ncbi:polysaccharide biosynthesis C-terminal domain-containing protein [Staphylococcus epidermidis]|uniref:Capsular polysaccharide synthesis enzyme CapF n=1 Tax=Staphylococcus haemolyticus (strain JCSC1435) TaxID=279808 RepID=Q4L9H3_STAHJ|nr:MULTISPECIES: NAD-dependent epimerase/dehydratase family protein [Staphylococcus]MBW5902814.1 NAD-dependent epimerase/dehydratase family protein [Staphylococcus haemolyticus]MCH4417171.1 NAD-dependent epimerase/dehydratase family protein [Staphylococcus haemolyticus]MCI2929094.1 NAD-dependent epimerase/dehydratase family protein [Staphylococcus haemolyticus]MCI2935963.1 NAD-dependent epimerase/dehydratase family protein [Staphylococcus haemolyticus]MCI2939692.1 NAD-dependent epimerase/dehyd
MKIVITGSNGFVGKNLKEDLKATTNNEILEVNRQTSSEDLKKYLLEADSVLHLAGINRPQREEEFKEGNVDFLSEVLEILKENPKKPDVILSSSIQATNDNPYGNSKRQGEGVLEQFSKENGNKVLIYRLPNLFGKWCKPNYNSVIATFCYKIARDEEIQVNDENVVLHLNYIDDVIKEFKNAIDGRPNIENGELKVPNVYEVKLGTIAKLLYEFKEIANKKSLPNTENSFEKCLYSTYLSYLPEDKFSYPLKMNVDNRGSFTEIFKTMDRGQVSVNISKPGIVKGNHWHHTKNEKFLVVSGTGVIRFRKIGEDEVIEYHVSGEKLEVVDIPVGYTHNIENLGDTDMVTIMWVNEIFDPNNPDTYFLEV